MAVGARLKPILPGSKTEPGIRDGFYGQFYPNITSAVSTELSRIGIQFDKGPYMTTTSPSGPSHTPGCLGGGGHMV